MTPTEAPAVTHRQAIPLIREHRPFRASNMSGVEGPVHPLGDLPPKWEDAYRYMVEADRVTYTVLSYATPIGWVLDGEFWITPFLRYSLTTTNHQAHLWGAIKGPFSGGRESPVVFPSNERAVPPRTYGPREGWW